jgi:hypothetical protein
MGDTGLEQIPEKRSEVIKNKEVMDESVDVSKLSRVHDRVHEPEFPPDLQEIIDQWESLPIHIKETIMNLVKTAKTY